jgi:hypothetical protein
VDHPYLGCLRKCLFRIPRDMKFYTELTLFRVIPQKILLYNTVKFRGIPYRFVYMEFRIPSSEKSSLKKLKKSTKGMVYAVEFRGIP